jgi:hypothetical protein
MSRRQDNRWSAVQGARLKGRTTQERISENEEVLKALHEKMASWNEFVREMAVLPDLGPALSTGRVELLALAKPRPLNEEECRILFDGFAVLIETNQALRMHAQLLSQLAAQQYQLAEGMVKKLGELVEFAEFRSPVDDTE